MDQKVSIGHNTETNLNPSTVLLVGLGISLLQFLGTMLWISLKIGEYKNQVEGMPREIENTVAPVKVLAEAAVSSSNALHQRFDSFWVELGELKGRIGSTEGQLERIKNSH